MSWSCNFVLCAVVCINQNRMETNVAASTRNRTVEMFLKWFEYGAKIKVFRFNQGLHRGYTVLQLFCSFGLSKVWSVALLLLANSLWLWLAQLSLSHIYEVFYAVIGMEIKHIPPSQFPSKRWGLCRNDGWAPASVSSRVERLSSPCQRFSCIE